MSKPKPMTHEETIVLIKAMFGEQPKKQEPERIKAKPLITNVGWTIGNQSLIDIPESDYKIYSI